MAMWEGKNLLDIKWILVGRGQELNWMGGYVGNIVDKLTIKQRRMVAFRMRILHKRPSLYVCVVQTVICVCEFSCLA